jgi:hypothetical protein
MADGAPHAEAGAAPPTSLLPPGLYTRSAGRFYSELLVEQEDNAFSIAWSVLSRPLS